jgi:hypothetical protein
MDVRHVFYLSLNMTFIVQMLEIVELFLAKKIKKLLVYQATINLIKIKKKCALKHLGIQYKIHVSMVCLGVLVPSVTFNIKIIKKSLLSFKQSLQSRILHQENVAKTTGS